MKRAWLVGLVSTAAAFLPAAAGAAPILLPRPGQIGVSIQGQYGGLLESGNLGDVFNSGGGYAIRLRYRMRYARAFGISFENQNFDAPGNPLFEFNPDAGVSGTIEPTPARSLRLVTTGVDLYQFSDPSERLQRYAGIGAGIFQSTVKLVDGETYVPIHPDGVYASLSAGIERFVWRSYALDFSGRYLAVFHSGDVNHDLQAAAGVIFYASY
jgi:hypothetical protein